MQQNGSPPAAGCSCRLDRFVHRPAARGRAAVQGRPAATGRAMDPRPSGSLSRRRETVTLLLPPFSLGVSAGGWRGGDVSDMPAQLWPAALSGLGGRGAGLLAERDLGHHGPHVSRRRRERATAWRTPTGLSRAHWPLCPALSSCAAALRVLCTHHCTYHFAVHMTVQAGLVRPPPQGRSSRRGGAATVATSVATSFAKEKCQPSCDRPATAAPALSRRPWHRPSH